MGFLGYNATVPGCIAAARSEGADFIVALTHIGYDEDLFIAANSTFDIDLIIGGYGNLR